MNSHSLACQPPEYILPKSCARWSSSHGRNCRVVSPELNGDDKMAESHGEIAESHGEIAEWHGEMAQWRGMAKHPLGKTAEPHGKMAEWHRTVAQ